MSQYYFVLQSLHKARPSTTLYYKACTKHVPVLLCTTTLAQGMSQYYFVLQSLHKTCPSTTLYYKACTKHVRVLLCTTKLAQNTSQYYSVLQLHKARPSTTLYYKACRKHVPVLLCTTILRRLCFHRDSCLILSHLELKKKNEDMWEMNSPQGGPQADCEFRPLSGTSILQTPHIYIIHYNTRYIDR